MSGPLRTQQLTGAFEGVVVTTPAEVDITNAQQVRDDLLGALSSEPAGLIIDMSATEFCAIAGVHALQRAYRRACTTHTDLRLVVTAPLVRRVLTLAGIPRIIDLHPSVTIARAAIQSDILVERLDGDGPAGWL